MISSFLKKLLFARQFYMTDGKIEVLGMKQVMLPSNLVPILQNSNPKKINLLVKKQISESMAQFCQRLGTSPVGMLNDIKDIFEIFGLGKLEIIDFDMHNKKTLVRIYDSPLSTPTIQKTRSTQAMNEGILSGIFSFLFHSDVTASELKQMGKGLQYMEFIVK